MIRDLNLLGLDDQYTSFSRTRLSLPIVFPKITDKEPIKYLLSLGYTCVFDELTVTYGEGLKPSRLALGVSLFIHEHFTIQDADEYLRLTEELIPIDVNKKQLFIKINRLHKIISDDR